MTRQKQPAGNRMHQPIELVRVARPKNQREHQNGPPGDLGKIITMNFMAEGFAPQAEDMEKAGNNKAEARKHSFCRLVGAHGLMTEKDFKAKNLRLTASTRSIFGITKPRKRWLCRRQKLPSSKPNLRP